MTQRLPLPTPTPGVPLTSIISVPTQATSVPLPVPSGGTLIAASFSAGAGTTVPAGTTATITAIEYGLAPGLPPFGLARSSGDQPLSVARHSDALPAGANLLFSYSMQVNNATTINPGPGKTAFYTATFQPGVIPNPGAGETVLAATSDGTNWYYNTLPVTVTYDPNATTTATFCATYTLNPKQTYGIAFYYVSTNVAPTQPSCTGSAGLPTPTPVPTATPTPLAPNAIGLTPPSLSVPYGGFGTIVVQAGDQMGPNLLDVSASCGEVQTTFPGQIPAPTTVLYLGPGSTGGGDITFYAPTAASTTTCILTFTIPYNPRGYIVPGPYTVTLTGTPQTQAPVAASPATVSLTSTTGSSTFTASQTGFTGAFTTNGTTACSGVATASVGTTNTATNSATVTVTGVSPGGSCTLTVSGASGSTPATVKINVPITGTITGS